MNSHETERITAALNAPVGGRMKTRPQGAGNTRLPLTRSLDLGKEGLAMKATLNDPVPSLPGEPWASAADHEGTHQVPTHGRVYNTPRPTTSEGLLKRHPDSYSYPRLTQVQGGRQLKTRAHTLAARTSIGDPPAGTEMRHLNGDADDPRLSNPAHGTHAENGRDTVRHGMNPSARKTHCPQRHPYDATNTMPSRGRRHCRDCNRRRPNRRWR